MKMVWYSFCKYSTNSLHGLLLMILEIPLSSDKCSQLSLTGSIIIMTEGKISWSELLNVLHIIMYIYVAVHLVVFNLHLLNTAL